jgi:uncharacterized protein (DUF1800 family)
MPRTTIRNPARLMAALAGLTAAGALPLSGQLPARPTPADAVHLLNRVAFGPRPGDVDRVLAMGLERYLDDQLHPERVPDTAAERYTVRLEVLDRTPAELGRMLREAQRARAAGDTGMNARERERPLRRYAAEVQQAAVARTALSERQLYEVLVDFWTNHFNVFMAKGLDRALLPDYVEHTIRPRALGRFEDLLLATAQSPAMLFYLDNALSVAEGAVGPPPERGSAAARQRSRVRLGTFRADSLRQLAAERMPRGLNENYARELLELHTLGVDGGYTQEDVVNVARIFTGWSIRLGRDLGFVFNAWAHDRSEKTVLGHVYASDGMDEGRDLLRFLARHPATMRHVSAKLCMRFVADTPPDGCVDAGVYAWERSDGDIREVVRAILTSPDFWSDRNRGTKVKTPLEFVVSAVRAVGGRPDTTPGLGQLVGRLGQPLYLQSAPTGYPEREESWVSTNALLERFNVAVALAAGRLPGVTYDVGALLPPGEDRAALVAAVCEVILHGGAGPATVETLRREVEREASPVTARALALGLALGSPEFQRQ